MRSFLGLVIWAVAAGQATSGCAVYGQEKTSAGRSGAFERIPAPEEEPEQEIVGWYAAKCTIMKEETGPKVIKATVLIKKIHDVYVFQWSYEGSTYLGVGQRDGDTISVGWKSGDQFGVTVYRIQGRYLRGRYVSLPGHGSALPEVLVKLRSLEDEV